MDFSTVFTVSISVLILPPHPPSVPEIILPMSALLCFMVFVKFHQPVESAGEKRHLWMVKYTR